MAKRGCTRYRSSRGRGLPLLVPVVEMDVRSLARRARSSRATCSLRYGGSTATTWVRPAARAGSAHQHVPLGHHHARPSADAAASRSSPQPRADAGQAAARTGRRAGGARGPRAACAAGEQPTSTVRSPVASTWASALVRPGRSRRSRATRQPQAHRPGRPRGRARGVSASSCRSPPPTTGSTVRTRRQRRRRRAAHRYARSGTRAVSAPCHSSTRNCAPTSLPAAVGLQRRRRSCPSRNRCRAP